MVVKKTWIDRYAAAWIRHADPDGAIDDLLGFLDPQVRYEDVPSGAVFVGHDEVRAMGAFAHAMSEDMTIRVVTSLCDGARFLIESEARGTHTGPMGSIPATGRPFVNRGVSVGELSTQGLVTAHRDYWDLGQFLTQCEILPTEMRIAP